jgi:peptide-methionine (S)-S-oxide reductase
MTNVYLLVATLFLNVSVNSCDHENKESIVDLSTVQEGTGVATFAGGCFWCTEAVFERMIGVKDVVSGYTGGTKENPTYRQVSYGETDHAEAVQIYYDPKVVTYQELLDVFFATHDPTQLNRQGPDVGKQYRSAVYYHDAVQKKALESTLKKLNASGKYHTAIVTEVASYSKFYLAEDYHQNYYELNQGNPYVISIAIPKVKKFKKLFPEKVKAEYK